MNVVLTHVMFFRTCRFKSDISVVVGISYTSNAAFVRVRNMQLSAVKNTTLNDTRFQIGKAAIR